jgi:hypothetical protein
LGEQQGRSCVYSNRLHRAKKKMEKYGLGLVLYYYSPPRRNPPKPSIDDVA